MTKSPRERASAALRQRAEGRVQRQAVASPVDVAALSPAAARQALHELQVHRLQLQTQNAELHRTQAELDVARARYFDLYDLAPIGYLTLSDDGRVVEANLAAAALLGVTRGALVSQALTAFVLPADQDVYYRFRRQLLGTQSPTSGQAGTPQSCELRMLRAGAPAPFWARWEATTAPAPDGTLLCRAVLSDISERRQADEALRESEEKYRRLVEHAQEAVFVVQDGVFRFVNPACSALSGRSAAELIGSSILDRVPEAARKRLSAHHEQVLRGDRVPPTEEFAVVTAQDQLVRLLVNAVRIEWEGRPATLNFASDITALKQAEAAHDELEVQLRQAHKMEAIGRLAGGVAHDFNNKLQMILGITELLVKTTAPTDPRSADLQDIMTAAQSSADLTRQLLAFARRQTIAPKVLDLNDTVAGMLRMLARLIGEDINLVWQPGTGLWPVKMDPSQLDQLLANLAVNARDAITGVGNLSIATGNITVDAAYGKAHPDATPGAYVMLSVSDNGCGMDTETLARIFEPFFTTKPLGQGTGLGLATVYGIVRQNNGFIDVRSAPGQGTTFAIYLPRHAVTAADDDAASEPTAIATGTGTVLLVEDEAPLLRLAARLLEDLGYTVLTADGTREALRLAAEYPGEIRLLLTDVVMPDMSGRELRDRLCTLRPAMKCLFMSGYTADAIVHRGVLDAGLHFIQKPFSSAEIAAKLHAVLAGEGGSP